MLEEHLKLYKSLHLTTPEKILTNEINIFNDFIRLDVLTKPKGIT